MKDIKITLKATADHCRQWGKMLWRHYLLLAALAAIFIYAFTRVCATTLLPLWILRSETSDWDLILAVVGLDILWVSVCIIALAATGVASVMAHRRMKALVTTFDRKELGRSHRGVLTAIVVLLLTGTAMVAFLPTVALALSYNAAALSGMMLDDVATPAWLHPALLATTMVAVLCCEIAATVARLCYRTIPAVKMPEDTDPQLPIEE